MTFGGDKLQEVTERHNVITPKVIRTNQKTELSVYRLQRAHASFDITCDVLHRTSFQAFCRYVSHFSLTLANKSHMRTLD